MRTSRKAGFGWSGCFLWQLVAGWWGAGAGPFQVGGWGKLGHLPWEAELFSGIADKVTSVLIGLVFPTMNKLGIFTEVNYNKKEKKDRRRKEESAFVIQASN